MKKPIYKRFVHLGTHPRAVWVLAFVAFIESIIFPIPPDMLLIPMMLADPHKAWRYAFICLIFSVLGGVLGYMIGALFYDIAGTKILSLYGQDANFEKFQIWYNNWGSWVVFIGGISPVPYKAITILSGATGLPLSVFIVASLISRGVRFFILAALVIKFGPKIHVLLDSHFRLFIFLIICLMAGIFGFFKLF